jgi:cbb3-type cytochrome oxidase subunit 1
MTTESKLMTLERMAGLFSWAWIIASITALVILVMAVGFGVEWTNFLWALGISLVAKWIARGFERKKIRVAFESKLIAQGMSPKEAAKEWNKQYRGQK